MDESEILRTSIDYFTHENSLRKNPALPACLHHEAWFHGADIGKEAEFDNVLIQYARTDGDDSLSHHFLLFVENPRRNPAPGVPEQQHTRACLAHLAHTSDQAIRREYGQVNAQAIALAEVDLHIAPPIGGVAGDDMRSVNFPRGGFLKANHPAQAIVFPLQFRLALELHLQFGILAPQFVVLLDQILPWNDRVTRLFGDALAGTGQAEKRQKQTANRELELCRGARWKLKDDNRQHDDAGKQDVLPAPHRSADSFVRELKMVLLESLRKP